MLGSVWVLVVLAITIASRIGYPFDLEWMEGGILLHVALLREGRPIYVPPGADFTPFLYPPLYPQLLAWISPPALVAGRIVSVLGAAAAVGALLAALRRRGVPWFIAIGAAGAFLSCYDDSGAFYDVARCDSLALALVTWALVLGLSGGRRRTLAGAALLFLAFTTKQSMALAGIPVAWTLARRDGLRAALGFALPALVLGAGATAWMCWRTGGWFWVYVVRVPALHGIDPGRLAPDPEWRLFAALPLMALSALAAPVLRVFGRPSGKSPTPAPASLVPSLVTLVLLAVVMRAHRGGFHNVLMPGFWALSVGGALVLARLREWRPRAPGDLAAAAALCLQCVAGGWRPATYEPTPEDRRAGESVVAEIRARPGTIFAPEFPTLALAAGRWPGTHIYALADLDRPRSPWRGAILAMQADLAAGRWDMVLTSRHPTGVLEALHDRYHVEREFQFPDRVGFPRSGFPVRPEYLWVRNLR